MSKETKLGFVKLPASEVVSLAETALATLLSNRELRRLEFLEQFMFKRVGWFGRLAGRKPLTMEEQVVTEVKEDYWLASEYYYLTPKWVSPKQEALLKLINVGNHLLTGGNTTMTVSIEAADWLFPQESPKT